MGLGKWAAAVAALTLGSGGWLAFGQPGTPAEIVEAAQPPSTALEIEFVGGFAFVQSNPRLDVAYLNNALINLSDTRPLESGETDRVVCNVAQIGAQLEVVRGNIVSTAPPNAPEQLTRIIDLNGKKNVTFPGLEAGTDALNANHTWPPTPALPTPASDPNQWLPLHFIPGLTKHHPMTGLHANWVSKVNGRIRLKGGTVTAGVPSTPQMQESYFDFTNVSGSQSFNGAMTDRVVYTATVTANNIAIVFTGGGTSSITRIEVEPVGGEPVKLRVRGKHNGAGPQPGGKLVDFCAFYSLFDNIPAYEEWVEPSLIQPAVVVAGGAQPSPGFFCPADWF